MNELRVTLRQTSADGHGVDAFGIDLSKLTEEPQEVYRAEGTSVWLSIVACAEAVRGRKEREKGEG